jgi:DHHC palmitoyltransferase
MIPQSSTLLLTDPISPDSNTAAVLENVIVEADQNEEARNARNDSSFAAGSMTQNPTAPEHSDSEPESAMLRQWRASPYAVGLTHATWADEEMTFSKLISPCDSRRKMNNPTVRVGNTDEDDEDDCGCSDIQFFVRVTAYLLRNNKRASRIGNMVVLASKMEEVEDPYFDDSSAPLRGRNRNVPKINRPRPTWIVGPFFLYTMFVTIPLLGGLSLFTAFYRFLGDGGTDLAFIMIWLLLNIVLFVSLFQVSCTDPGILHRYEAIPLNSTFLSGDGKQAWHHSRATANSASARSNVRWIWNDQALTFRPQRAKYSSDCAVIIEEFDHVCPWTGTAIGGNNKMWFNVFYFTSMGSLIYNIMLLVSAF